MKTKMINYVDPFFWYLRLILNGFFNSDLSKEEGGFVIQNITKHQRVQWLTALSIPFILFSLKEIPVEQIGSVIASLIAPVMVLGGAWFSISFGAIPEKLMKVSMSITFWMYTGFKISFVTMFIAIGFISPIMLYPVLALIYLAVDISCAQYDTADGLKAGLDEAMLTHSRAAIIYYGSQGISIKSLKENEEKD